MFYCIHYTALRRVLQERKPGTNPPYPLPVKRRGLRRVLFYQEHLPHAAAREQRRLHYEAALEALEERTNAGELMRDA